MAKPRRPACKFFREKKCTLGSNCRFEHALHSRDNSISEDNSFPQLSSSSPSLLSTSQTPAIMPTKLPTDQCTVTHSENSQPKSSASQPKSDSGRIVKGEINGLTFQVEIIDPASIMAFAPRRDFDEETDYSYVEPEPIVAAMSRSPRTDSELDFEKAPQHDFITSSYHKQLEELEKCVKDMQPLTSDNDEVFGNTSDYSEYSDIQPAHPPKLCKFHQQGLCRYGDACIYSHAIPINPAEEKLMQKELLESQAIECGICMDLVLRQGERFGLLSGCNHAFCLKCVRTKDSNENIRQCPVCQADIEFVVPSNRYVRDEARRSVVFTQYKQNVAQIPCRHFALGRGVCPFGVKCFYEHRFANGTLESRGEITE